jgi:hypothetical protein
MSFKLHFLSVHISMFGYGKLMSLILSEINTFTIGNILAYEHRSGITYPSYCNFVLFVYLEEDN